MNIESLKIGREVVTNADFSGVPKGTRGEIVFASNSWPETESVAVAWERYPGDRLTDWFAFDELKYLDVPHSTT